MAKQSSPKPENQEKVYVATVRTALSGPEDGIMRKLPTDYASSSVGEVIKYLTDKKQVTQEEAPTVKSIASEMAKEYTIDVNGQTVSLTDKVESLFKSKTHKGRQYMELSIEIASSEEGGLYYRLW
jgi:hypothetical protein